MSEQMKLRKQGKTWKLKSMLPSTAITTTSNSLNQNNNYKLPSETDKYIEELELHKQLEEDLKDLYQKKETARI